VDLSPPQAPLPAPALVQDAPPQGGGQQIVQAPAPPPPKPKQIVYVEVKRCADGSGTVAYEKDGMTQIEPIESRAAQCSDPLVVLEDGKRYFGCRDGKIILDCDWFMETAGQETVTENVTFGSSQLEDFAAPDISHFSCADGQIDQDLLLRPQGKICDLQ